MRTRLASLLLLFFALSAAGCGGGGGTAASPQGATAPLAALGRIRLVLATSSERVQASATHRALVQLLDERGEPVVGDTEVDLDGAGSRAVTISGIPYGTWTLEVTIRGISGSGVSFFRSRVTIGAGDPVTVKVLPVTSLSLAVDTPQLPLGLRTQVRALGATGGPVQDLTAEATWSLSNESVASLGPEPGTVHSLAEGATRVFARYGPLQAETTILVSPAVLSTLSIQPSSLSLPLGLRSPLQALGVFTDGVTRDVTTSVQWSSSAPGVVSVSGAEALGLGLGNASVSALHAASGISASVPVEVTPAILTGLAVTSPAARVAVGRSIPVTATGTFSDGLNRDVTDDATWTVTPALATVASRQITGVAPGAATVEATYGGRSATLPVDVVAKLLESITLSPATVGMPKGTTRGFTATGSFSDGSVELVTEAVDWVSGDPGVLAVSNLAGSKGQATALGDGGLVTLTATDALTGVSGTAQVTLGPAVLTSLTINPNGGTMMVGDTMQFRVTGMYSDGAQLDVTEQLDWTSSDPMVLSVSNTPGSKGFAQALSAGAGPPVALSATDPGTGMMIGTGVTVLGGAFGPPPGGGGPLVP